MADEITLEEAVEAVCKLGRAIEEDLTAAETGKMRGMREERDLARGQLSPMLPGNIEANEPDAANTAGTRETKEKTQ